MSAAPLRRFVARACEVCEWQGQAVETTEDTVECPWCHALTRIEREDWLVPVVPGRNPHATALGQMGASRGGTARAERLAPSRRREIARKAAQARWRRK